MKTPIKKARDIANVVVEGISLVSQKYTPAVPKAETRFALFKAQPKWMAKLQKFFGVAEDPKPVQKFKRRKLIKAEQKQELRKIRLQMINVR